MSDSTTSAPVWSLLSVPLSLLSIGGLWVGIALLFRAYRQLLVPPDAFLSSGTRIGNILMCVPPFFPSISFGFFISNFLFWCIPPARATIGPTADGNHPVFRATQFTFARFGGVMAVIALPVCFLGASNLWAITPNRIDYRPLFRLATQHNAWSNVEKIEMGCYIRKGTGAYMFVVTLDDGTRIDLMEESPRDFVNVYPQIQSAVEGHPYEFSSSDFVGRCAARAPSR